MIRPIYRILLLASIILYSISLFPQCTHCSAPATPAEYGGGITTTMYKNATLQLWATKPSTAVDGRDWFKVKKAGDTTFVGSGDTLTVTVDTTCKYIAHNINVCSCGGANYYSAYVIMANITVKDTTSVPQYSISCAPTMCSKAQTNVFFSTTSTLPALSYQYLRDDTANVSGSFTGTFTGVPFGLTLTNKTSTAQVVRFVVRMYQATGAFYYFDSKSFYITVLPDTPVTTRDCTFPTKPNPWPAVYTRIQARGAQVQFSVDTTVVADTVMWYRVIGTDTTYAGKGYTISVTTDTPCSYIARNMNVCTCSSSIYYSLYTQIANYSIATGSRCYAHYLNFMPTIASGTALDIVPKPDSTTSAFFVNFYRDNAYVSGTTVLTESVNRSSYQGAIGLILTNTTTSPQLVKYCTQTSVGNTGIYGDMYTGYVTVLPSTSTAPAGNHCSVPARPSMEGQYSEPFIKGAMVNLDLRSYGYSRTGSVGIDPYTADTMNWYETRWPGDTSFIGNLSPVNLYIDTPMSVLGSSENVCYWSDSSKHIYHSATVNIINIAAASITPASLTMTNSKPNACSGDSVNISVSTSASGQNINWYRSNLKGVTGTDAGVVTGSSLTIKVPLTDTVSTPQKVYFVAYVMGSNTQPKSSQQMTSVMVYPSCAKWANFSTKIYANHDSICVGDTATLTADTVPGIGSHYAWNTGDTTKSIRRTSASTYTVTVTNSCGCSATASKIIVVKSLPTPSVNSPAICAGMTDTLTATGGTSYLWSTGATTSRITSTTASTYSVTATNALGCSATASGTVTINANPTPSVNSPTVCAGNTATLTATGGTSYVWNTTATTSSITTTTAGTYSVTATNAAGCTATASGVVTVNANPTPTVNSPSVCAGATATLTATGGVSYLWSTTATTSSITTTITGVYTVTATNAAGCTATASGTVTVNALPTPTVNNDTICSGDTATLTATGGTGYLWSTTATTASISSTAAGVYSVTVTNASGCTATANGNVVVNALPTPAVNSDTICAGQTAALTATGGGSYLWSTSATTSSITTTTAGTYSVTATNAAGCRATASGVVTVNANPTPTANSPTVCAGNTATLTATGGTSYIWSTTATTSSIATTTAGVYTVTATNAAGCTATASGTVTVNALPTPTVSNDTICSVDTATLTASGGTSYLWSTTASTATITSTTAGAYSVTVTNASSCTATASGTIVVNALPTPTVNNATICSGDTAILIATGGSSYVWSTTDTTVIISTSISGTYTVTATNTFGCKASASSIVTVNANPRPTVNNATICTGDTASLTARGGSSYVWSTGDSTASITTIVSGTYYVTVSNSYGCKASTNADVTVNAYPIPSVNNDTVCSGTSGILTASGGSTYLWSRGDTTSTLTTKTGGTFSVTVTNAAGCAASASGIVVVKTKPNPSLSNDTVCSGQTAIITASDGISYLWSTGDTTATITTTSSGTYIVTVTNAFSCSAIDTALVAVYSNPSVAVTSDTIDFGATATLIASGATRYAWNTGDYTSSINETAEGIYTVTATDSTGCSATASGSVVFNPLTIPTVNNDTINVGDTATLTATGGARYLWSTGDTAARIKVAPISTTIYFVTVSNQYGWIKTLRGAVTVNCGFGITINNETTCADQNVTLSATEQGSHTISTYIWNTGTTTSSITTSSGGTYSVTVTDDNSCVVTASGVVTASSTPAVLVNNICLPSSSTGTLTAIGGDSYLWSTGQSGASISVSSVGTYTVTATNAQGCTAMGSGTVTTLSSPSSGGNVSYVNLYSDENFGRSINQSNPVGTIPAEHTTTPIGGVVYSIPVECPPGTNNMVPKVALSYNSQSDNGIMGWGWGLSGASSISRSGKDNFHDNATGPITMTNSDPFLIDGARLVPTNGNNGASGTTYGKELEDYSVTTSHSSFGSGPDWFEVVTKDGMTIEYGNTGDSKFLTDDQTNVLVWNINKIYDLDGNYMLFKYDTSGRESKLIEIDYTGNDVQNTDPYNRIQFFYSQRNDNNTTYSGGASVSHNNLLTGIQVTGEANALYKQYKLDYGKDELSSYFNSLTEYGADGSNLNSTIFQYGPTPNLASYTTPSSNYDAHWAFSYPSSTSSQYLTPVNQTLMSGDFNGDGYSDMLTVGMASMGNTALSSLTFFNFGFTVGFMNPATHTFDKKDQCYKRSNDPVYAGCSDTTKPWDHGDYLYFVGDYYGSGRDGVLEVKKTCVGAGHYQISDMSYRTYDNSGAVTKHSFTSPSNTVTSNFIAQGDFDGDGSLDYIIFTSDQTALISFPRKNIFNASLTIPMGLAPNYVIDFDGDGKRDLMYMDLTSTYIYTLSLGSGGYQFNLLSTLSYPNLSYNDIINFGDFNGDGKTDILAHKKLSVYTEYLYNNYQTTYNNSGTPESIQTSVLTNNLEEDLWEIAYSTGKTFTDKQLFDRYVGVSQNCPDYLLNSGAVCFIYTHTTPQGTTDISAEEFFAHAHGPREITIADFNGDGKSDIMWDTTSMQKYTDVYEHSGWLYSSCTGMKMFYSKGASFVEKNILNDKQLPGMYRVLGDFNGDGRTDLSFYNVGNIGAFNCSMGSDDYYQFSFNPFGQERLLQKVSDGFNQTQAFEYKLLTDPNGFHTPGTASTYPLVSAQIPMFAVSRITVPDGIGGLNITDYTYQDLKIHKGGKGLVGFFEIMANNNVSNLSNQSYFVFNSPYYVSTPFYNTTKFVTGGDISSHSTDYNFVPLSNNRFAMQKTNEYTYFYPGSSYVNVDYTYDNYGNVAGVNTDNNSLETTMTGITYTGTPTPSLAEQVNVVKTRRGSPSYSGGTRNTYDSKKHLVTSTDSRACGLSNSFGYDNFGNQTSKVSSTIFSSGGTRSQGSQYDALGRFPISVTNTLGQTEAVQYDPLWGKPIRDIGIDNNVTEYKYDGYGRVIDTRSPRGTHIPTTYAWDISSTGTLSIYSAFTQTPGRPDIKIWMDAMSREVKRDILGFNNNWLSGTTTYTTRGKQEYVYQPHYSGDPAIFNHYTYDDFNRVSYITNQFGTIGVTYSYDQGSGNMIATTVDPANRQTVKTTDVTNKVVQTSDPGGTLDFTYDSYGNQLKVKNNGTLVLSYTYDACNHMTQMVEPNNGATGYTYDGYGQMLTKRDARGNSYSMVYDVGGRVTQRTGPEGTTSYAYNATGQNGINQVSQITSFNGINQNYNYDQLGQKIGSSEVINGQTILKDFGYDNFGNNISVSYNTGVKVLYTYDAVGNIGSIMDAYTGNVLYQVNQMNSYGQASEYLTGNGKTSQLTTNYGIPTRYYTPSVQDLNLTYDWSSGDLTARRDDIKGLHEAFTYDASDRLVTSQVGNNILPAVNVSYADNGNLSTKDDVGDYSYDPSKINAVRHVTNTSNNISSLTQNISYTPFNQCAKITENNYELDYTYGSDYGRMYSRMKNNGMKVNERIYTGGYEKNDDGTGNPQDIHYIYANGNPICMIVKDPHNGVKEYYTYTDQLGSILTVTDDNASVVAEQDFDAWGRNRNTSNWSYSGISTVPNWLYRGYTGHEHLPEFALINMNGRIYDPLLGRMLSPDNVVQYSNNTQSYNRYSYVLNNPLKYDDPSGWQFTPAVDIANGSYANGQYVYNPNYSGSVLEQQSSNSAGYSVYLNGVYQGSGYNAAIAAIVSAFPNASSDPSLVALATKLGENSSGLAFSSVKAMLNYWALADLRKKPSSMDYPLLAAKDPPRNGQDKELFYWDYQFKLRVLSQRVDYINFSFTIPEYRVPLVGKIFGWTGSISYDMYGAIYVGGGASLGKSWEGPSLSLTANKLSQCAQPKPEELHNYLSGYSISFDAGYNFGTGFTLSPWSRGTIFSTHAGIYTPQMGGSVTLTPEFLIFQTGYGWAK